MKSSNPLTTRDIIKAAGGVVEVARELGLDHSSVSTWRRVPHQHLLRMAALTGIPVEALLSADDYCAHPRSKALGA